jgi:RNA polymerase sigma-70 factor (ECF subfamily)
MNAEGLEELLERLRLGDLEAIARLVAQLEPELRQVVRRRLSPRLRTKFDSTDVVQSVWVRMLHEAQNDNNRFASAAHLQNFLARVTLNCLTDRLRHFRNPLKEEQPLADDTLPPPAPDPRPSEIAQAAELWDQMLALSAPEHHELLRLKRQGLTLSAIAQRTGYHEDSIRRIVRQLARRLARSTAEFER